MTEIEDIKVNNIEWFPQICDLSYSGTKRYAVAASSLTGNFWEGQVMVLDDNLKVLDCISSKFGVASVTWVGEKQELLAFGKDDGSIELWIIYENNKKKLIRTLTGHQNIVSAVTIQGANSSTIISASWDRKIKIWEDRSNSATTLEGHSDTVLGLSCLTQNTLLSASKDSTVKIWDLQKESCVQTIPTGNPVFCIATSPSNENIFATGNEVGELYSYDIRSLNEPVFKKMLSDGDSLKTIKFSPNSKKISCGGDSCISFVVENETKKILYENNNQKDFITCMSWSSDENFVSGSWDSNCNLLNHHLS